MILKLLGSETTLSAASNINSSTLLRILNPTASSILVTITDINVGVIGTFTIIANEIVYLQKKYTDTITGNGLLCVPVAYTSG